MTIKQKKSTTTHRLYPELPYIEKCPTTYNPETKNYDLDPIFLKKLNRFKRWMYFEQTGSHVSKSIKSKDHFKTVIEESASLLGEAPKKILKSPSEDRYLFKEPKVKGGTCHGFKETITELLMTRISSKLTKTAESAIAKYQGRIGFLSKIFISREHGERLIHGVEIFSKLYGDDGISEIQSDREKQRRFYSVEHVVEALGQYLSPEFESSEIKSIVNDFYLMLLVDAFVGNMDRHAENWGLIERRKSNQRKISFAPIFDTARGLFWNTHLIRLSEQFLINGSPDRLRITKYANKSSGLISLDGNPNTTHLDIVHYIKVKSPKVYACFASRLHALDIQKELAQFSKFFSPHRRLAIESLLNYRKEIILNVVAKKDSP